jgi:hypothetical protein
VHNSNRLASHVPPAKGMRPCKGVAASARRHRVGALVLTIPFLINGISASARAKETFSIDYIVSVAETHPETAEIRWELSGIEEVKFLRLQFPADRLDRFSGTGTLERIPGGLRWVPGGPYAHLKYRARINHVRGQHQRYDSYAAGEWVVTRARDLFPRIAIEAAPGKDGAVKSRARLIFRLPKGWHSAAALTALGADSYRLNEPGKQLDRPRGWFALGKVAFDHQEIDGTMVQVARAPGTALQPAGLFRLLDGTLPALKKLLKADAEEVLIVSAPDPMWHGGISGERSLFMHGGRPLRTPDKTSPYLHELFHVLQPFKPAADADWIEEGLAEFYSLELQRRAGLVDAAGYMRALGYFERYGLWNVDLTRQQDNPATNNAAPLVMYALDQRIQHATAGKARLDDVVTRLAMRGGVVGTDRFRRTVNAVSGRKFTKFFERHVVQGVPPSWGAGHS